jgi:hypothetical protein
LNETSVHTIDNSTRQISVTFVGVPALAHRYNPPHSYAAAGDACHQLDRLRRATAARMPQPTDKIADTPIALALISG